MSGFGRKIAFAELGDLWSQLLYAWIALCFGWILVLIQPGFVLQNDIHSPVLGCAGALQEEIGEARRTGDSG